MGFDEREFNRRADEFSGGQKPVLRWPGCWRKNLIFYCWMSLRTTLTWRHWNGWKSSLSNYRGSVLLVSHDRRFLDKVVTRILDLHQGKLYSYPGNYTDFRRQKRVRWEALEKAYRKQQEEINAAEEFIRRYKAGVKARQARGRQTRLQRLHRIEHPGQEATISNWNMEVKVASGGCLTISGLSKSYPQPSVLNKPLLRKGRAALIGPNGCGKSTLKIIVMKKRLIGHCHWAARSPGGHCSEHEGLDQVKCSDRIGHNSDCTIEEARTMLGRMLFRR